MVLLFELVFEKMLTNQRLRPSPDRRSGNSMHANFSEKGWKWTLGLFCLVENITIVPFSDFICARIKTDWCLALHTLKCCIFFSSITPSTPCEVFYPHLLLINLSPFLSPPASLWGPEGGRSSTDADIWSPYKLKPQSQHHTSFPSFYTSPTSDTCGFFKDKRHGVISVPVTSAHSYWFLVFFPLLVYVESVVCLCSASVGGLCPFCLKDTSNSGQRDARCFGRHRNSYFFLRLPLTLVIVFYFLHFYGKHHKTEERRTSSRPCFRCLLEKCIIFWKEKCCFISETKHELVWNYSVQFRWSKQLSATLDVSTDSFWLLLGGKLEGPFMHRCSALEQIFKKCMLLFYI